MRKLSLLLLLLMLQLAMYGRGNKVPSLSQGPLSFIENKGQIRDQNGKPRTDIDFILQTKGMVLYIGKGQLHYQFVEEGAKDTTHYTRENPPKHYQPGPGYITYRLDVDLEGVNASAAALKEGAQAARYHYYTNGTQEGITGVQSYSRITYKDIYPGIDWVLYTKDGKLKYDFVVHPGGKVGDIRLNYAGASDMSVAKDGSLKITTPLGDLNEDAPYSYEQGTRKAITSHYLLNGNTLSIVTGAYKGILVIDPGVDWATYFGSTGDDPGSTIEVDNLGYIYLAGLYTSSLTGIATFGAFQDTLAGGYADGYLAKFDSTGQLLWATYYGGAASASNPVASGFDIATNVACDTFGHVYLAGFTFSDNGIATPGSYQDTLDFPIDYNAYASSGFLVQFNSAGIRQWGTYYGGSALSVYFYGLACDGQGNVYAGGLTDSSTSTTGALVTAGAHQTQYGGAVYDGLLVKFDSNGNRQWATYYGGQGNEQINAVVCDNTGDVYIGGSTSTLSTIGIASSNGYQTSFPTFNDNYQDLDMGFFAKFTSDGVRTWGSYVNGSVLALALDRHSHLYIAGQLNRGNTVGDLTNDDTSITTSNCWQPLLLSQSGTAYNGFLMRFNKDACTRDWGTYYGGLFQTAIHSVVSGENGDVYIAGSTNSKDSFGLHAIASEGSHQDMLAGTSNDAFIAQFDSTGWRKWASYYGGTLTEEGTGLAYDHLTGAIYLAGTASSISGIATANAYQSTNGGASDAFLVRWLPVDIGIKRESPAADTVCTGDVPLTVSVSNLGRMDDTGDIVITYTYTGPSEGGDTLTFTGGLPVGAVESYSLGSLPLSFEGSYAITIYLHYTQDDNEINNDTLHFSLTATTAEPIANIEYSQIGTNYQFSNPDGLSSYTYHWDFGDGDTSSEATPTHSYTADGTYDVTLIVTGWCGSDTAHLSLDAVGTGTGVSGISNDNLLTVYPNPAKGDLYIKAAGLTMKRYEVVNALGQTMLNGTLNGQQDKINVSGLSAGAYYIRIETNKGIAEKPFQVLR